MKKHTVRGLRNMSLMWRLSISAILALIAMLVIMWEAVSTMEELLYDDRELKTRHLVEVAHGVVDGYYQQAKSGAMPEDDAKQAAAAAVKKLRYEGVEYFWINDRTAPVPKMVMHPTVPTLDGKVLDEARFNKAISMQVGLKGEKLPLDKKNLFVAFNDVVAQGGHGYVEYLWPKPKQGGGVTDELFVKLSYVKQFEPWGWVIGSGIYVDDVETLFYKHATHSVTLAIGGTLILLIAGWLVRRSIIGEFGGEPRVAMKFTGQIADGDLTGDIHLKSGDNSSVLAVLRDMQVNLRDMLRALFENARKVEGSIERLSSESNEISLATQLQANAIAQTRSGIEGVSASVDVVNGLAAETERSSTEVASRAHDGADVAQRVAGEMETIAQTVSASSQEVARLVESTREIDSMANVIKEIADQTNLLALNAAIEAARAGEQGRGFAVVADEVRKLAERTAKATSEIGTVLQSIQADTDRAVKGMNAAGPVIARGVEQANAAAETLRDIEARSRDTLAKMKQLSGATRDQTHRINEIVSNVDDVMHASAQTEGVIKQSLQSAAELEAAAKVMFDMVKRFNIGDVSGLGATSSADKDKPLIAWSPALAVGHKDIDEQHQKLIAIANRLNSAMAAGHGRDVAGKILNELVDYTVNHFAFEEKLMERTQYTDREAHLAQHKKLIDDVSKFKRQFDAGNSSISVELMGFIRDWLVNHILKVDKALSRDLKKRGLN